jgi:uncharacterized RDD family membrane protein YckC
MATVRCSVCGKEHEEYAISRVGDCHVCTECKPAFLERFQEGALLLSEMVYKGFWMRVVAKLLDCIVLSAACYIVGLIGVIMGGVAGKVFEGIILAAMVFGYVTFFLGGYGATPGKMACGIKVVRSSGEGVSYARAFGRAWAEWLSSIIFCIGYIMAAFDGQKRALHDRICDTRVVKAGR